MSEPPTEVEAVALRETIVSLVRHAAMQNTTSAAATDRILAAMSPALEARAEVERLRRMADSGTAENFLSCNDDTKRLMFALFVDDSSRRKAAESEVDRLTDILEGLQCHICGEHLSVRPFYRITDAGRDALANLGDPQ
jgi:hypothetical protein